MKKKELLKKLENYVEELGTVPIFENPAPLDAKYVAKFKSLEDLIEDCNSSYLELIITVVDSLSFDYTWDFANKNLADENYDYITEWDIFNDYDLAFESEDYIESFNETFSKDIINKLKDLYVIYNYIRENVNFDSIQTTLDATKLYVNIMPFQEENFNTEGSYYNEFLKILLNKDSIDVLKGVALFKSLLNSEDIYTKLFQSQNYDFIDLHSDDMLESSKFLKSFKRELVNLTSQSAFLTFLVEMSVEDYFSVLKGKSKLIFKKGICGLFDPVHGSGSVLELELEKPFEIKAYTKDKDDLFYDCWMQLTEGSNYGYDVAQVYEIDKSFYKNSEFEIEEIGKKTFKIPVEWSVFGRVEIEAETLEEALEIFCKTEDAIPLPTDGEYIDETFRVSAENSPYDNIENCAKELKEYYGCLVTM